MSRKENDGRIDAAACLSENLELKEKNRRLESERDAALVRLREMEEVCRESDSTVRETSETELRTRAMADLLEGITEGTQDLIAAKDTGYRFIFFNKAFRDEVRRIHGIDIAIGSNIIDALSHVPEDQEKSLRLWNRALNGEAFTIVEELGVPGCREIYEIRFNPLRNAEGEIIGAAHIVRNVSARVREEEELRQSRERFQSLVETVNDWVWEVDRNGIYTYVSPRVRDLLGYAPEEVLGKTPLDLMTASERKRVGGASGRV